MQVTKNSDRARHLLSLSFLNIHQFIGECWSGPSTQDTFFDLGLADENACHNQCFEKCRTEDAFCTGKHFANAVYGIGEYNTEMPLNSSERDNMLPPSENFMDNRLRCIKLNIQTA